MSDEVRKAIRRVFRHSLSKLRVLDQIDGLNARAPLQSICEFQQSLVIERKPSRAVRRRFA